jgi:hypothetical protein
MNGKFFLIGVIALVATSNFNAFGQTFYVTNTSDTGTGSLRDAITQANASATEPDSIAFQIPKSDPNYVDSTGVWLIRPGSPLPEITGLGTLIDGHSQAMFIGSQTNPKGPEILIDGVNAGATEAPGLKITGDGARVRGLVIYNFSYPKIWIRGDHCQISGCYIGTDATGLRRGPNFTTGWCGILIQGAKHTQIVSPNPDSEFNVISANQDAEVLISNSAKYTAVIGNIIGLSADKQTKLGSSNSCIRIQQYADSSFIFDNFIGGNRTGIWLHLETTANEIANNFIGTDGDRQLDWGNRDDGIELGSGAKNNFIVENIIGKNGRHGINISHTEATGNRLSQNRISGNKEKGISNITGLISPPVISSITATAVTGTAAPNATIEIYSDSGDEGAIFEGTTTADALGNFKWEGTAGGPKVNAIAIDANGNTSEFSGFATKITSKNKNSQLSFQVELEQNFPNPFNPQTTIQFHLQQKSHVTVAIYNVLWQKVMTLVDNFYDAGPHRVRLNASLLPSGIYFYQIKAGQYQAVKRMVLLE